MQMRRPGARNGLLGVGVAALFALSACSSGTTVSDLLDATSTVPPTASPDETAPDETAPDDPGKPRTDSLDWAACEDDVDADFDCATLIVPLDHDDPDGDTLDLSLIRLAATEPRLGAVLLNPGGPGASGVDLATFVALDAVENMGLWAFDIIGFDPRGVDRSDGLRCITDEEFDTQVYLDLDADDPDDDALAEELDQAFADGCRQNYGDSLRHFSTVATARDMDAIREALGDDVLHYIGISYGTYLGAVYTTLFPERVGNFVLDSAFEPTDDSMEEQYLTQLVGFEEAFDEWAAGCQANPSCPFHHPDLGQAWDDLLDELVAEPVPATDGRLANGAVMETATITALYDPMTASLLSRALADVAQGDPSLLFLLADSYIGRNPDGTYSTRRQSHHIISCASGFSRDLPDDPEALADMMRAAAPRFAADITGDDFDEGCSDLLPGVALPALSNTGDGRFMVIGGLHDPATPFRWSEKMAEVLGPEAVLVTWSGDGHGQLFDSKCLQDLAGRLLTDGELPPEGVVCDPDPPLAPPDWWADLPVPAGVGEQLPPELFALLGFETMGLYGEAFAVDGEVGEISTHYQEAFAADGLTFLNNLEVLPGVEANYFVAPDDDFLIVVVFGGAARDDPEMAIVFNTIGPDQSLVVLTQLQG